MERANGRKAIVGPVNKPRILEGGPGTIAELVAHYRLKELVGENQGRKSFSTRAGFESYLNGWILPRCGGITDLITSSR
jgi:hypothetical protein